MWTMKKAEKGSLNVNDSCSILQFIQEQTAPLLSLRALCNVNSPTSWSCTGGQPYPGQHRSAGGSGHGSGTGKHSLVQKKEHPPKSGRGGTDEIVTASMCSTGGLNLASLDDFPPVSVSLQDSKRYCHSSARRMLHQSM